MSYACSFSRLSFFYVSKQWRGFIVSEGWRSISIYRMWVTTSLRLHLQGIRKLCQSESDSYMLSGYQLFIPLKPNDSTLWSRPDLGPVQMSDSTAVMDVGPAPESHHVMVTCRTPWPSPLGALIHHGVQGSTAVGLCPFSNVKRFYEPELQKWASEESCVSIDCKNLNYWNMFALWKHGSFEEAPVFKIRHVFNGLSREQVIINVIF